MILSAFIGFGVLTLVVQEGHFASLIGLDRTGPIETFVPPIAFAILFGLSMDYMVFLMSRIREEHVHGMPTRLAIAILTDALIVRMTLVPSLLTLLGEKSWYIPRWLDRALPNITIEPPHEREISPGPSPERPAEAAGRP